MSKQEFLDKYLNKYISKTLSVTIIATVGLFSDKLTGYEWMIVVVAYIGATKWTETVLKLRNKL